MQLGGAMFWSLDLDDFQGTVCNQGKYPLVNRARQIVMGNQPIVSSTNAPSTNQSPTAANFCLKCKFYLQ
jgi:chitinase